MDYRVFYSLVLEEQDRLRQADVTDDFRRCKALAALYELQEHLANRIAEEGAEK